MIVGSHSVFAEKPIFSDWIGSFAKWWVAEVLLDQEFENTEIKTDIAIPLDKPTGFGLLKSDGKTTGFGLLKSDEKTTNEIKTYQQELNYISVKNKVIQEEIQYLRAENEEYRALIKLLNSDEKTTNEISSVIYDDIYTAKNKNNPSSFSPRLSYEFADVGMGASSSIQTTDNIKLDKYFLYVESIPASATNIENTVLSAVKFWESRVDVKFEIVDSINDANLILKFVQELPGPYAGFVFNGKLVKISLGNSNCHGNWQSFDEQTITSLVTHELGHVMGFKHSQDQNSIMYLSIGHAKYSQIKESYTLSPGESLFIQGCTLRPETSYYYEILTDDAGKKIDYFFIPSEIEYQNFLDGKQFKYYSDPDCLDLNRSGQIGICKNVSDNAGLLLIAPRTENESQFSVKVLLQEIL